MEENDDAFIKGANAGYLLSKYDPDLLKLLLKQKTEGNEYFEGIEFGHQEHERELFLENLRKNKSVKQNPKGPRLG